MTNRWLFMTLFMLALFVGCATVPPASLVNHESRMAIKYDGASVSADGKDLGAVHWVPYLDGKRIPESCFYKLAGDLQASAEALRRERLSALAPLGLSVAMFGLGNLAAALTYAPEGTWGWVLFGVSVPLFLGGNGAMVLGAFNYRNVLPSEDAIRMADEFNKSEN
jgi:hypothetical protein